MTPEQNAEKAFYDGGFKDSNPYPIGTTDWDRWADKYMELTDEHFKKGLEK